jgi:hypothetical protein
MVAVGLLGLAAAAAFLVSGLLLLLTLVLTPDPGNDALVVVLKSADAIGWLGIGLWLLVVWWHLRFRFLVPPAAAWIWTYLFAWIIGGHAHLNWGY